jgi:hypothetical protein
MAQPHENCISGVGIDPATGRFRVNYVIFTDDCGSVLRVLDGNMSIQQGFERDQLLDMHRATQEEFARLSSELSQSHEQQPRTAGIQ